ncbi:MAG: hypothetical protein HY349_05460 [Nitrospirae bacterium]|nr:hypothetical protein [Nitrospirota bacterium]
MPDSGRRVFVYRRKSGWERLKERWQDRNRSRKVGPAFAPKTSSQPAGKHAIEKSQDKGWAILRDRLRKVAAQGLQVLMVLAIVTVFFSFFLLMLVFLFPSEGPGGTWIQQATLRLPSNLGLEDSRPSDRSIELWSGGQTASYELGMTEPVAAYLTYKKNDVRGRRAGEIVWTATDLDMALYDRDAVQTLKSSRAIVTFDSTNFLDLDENAMVIIKRIEDNPILRDRRTFLVMVEGNLRGRIEATPERNMDVAVTTAAGEVRVKTAKIAERRADFAVKVNPDQSTSLTVFDGEATLTAAGKTVTVKENEVARVAPNQAPSDPEPIPAPVALHLPVSDAQYYYRDFPPRIVFDWEGGDRGYRYHIQVGRDPLFRDRVLDEVTTKRWFMFGNLRAGDYRWRVSAVNKDGLEGAAGEVRPIKVTRDLDAPRLVLLSPSSKGTIKADRILVRGRSETGARVFVNGKPAAVEPDGSFSQKAALKEGVNVIVVEAVDPAGNTAYQTRIINRKP